VNDHHTYEQIYRAASLLQDLVDCLNRAAGQLLIDEWASDQQLVIQLPETSRHLPQLRRIDAVLLDR